MHEEFIEESYNYVGPLFTNFWKIKAHVYKVSPST